MKNINDLPTPNFLIDLDILENNIQQMANLCNANNKKLIPMLKTHKSSLITKMQMDIGAEGFLVGTLDEAEMAINNGCSKVFIAYPIANTENIKKITALTKRATIILAFDGFVAAEKVNSILAQENITLDYLLIIDSGLHRFGVKPVEAVSVVQAISVLNNLKFMGIATHPGHVYGQLNIEGVKKVAAEETEAMTQAYLALKSHGFLSKIVATGSTPTLPLVVDNDIITDLRPGNYVFNDAIQVALGVASVSDCAFSVLATIISHPADTIFIIDAGSKCLGLDKGAHGNTLLKGYGIVKNHPEAILESLSEEVGKIQVVDKTNLKVGDKIEIIPNHACAAANMTSYALLHKDNMVVQKVPIDARGGSKEPSI